MTNPLNWQFHSENFRFLIVKPKSKKPISEWKSPSTHLMYNDPKLIEHIHNGGNVGIITGYGGLIIIDCDRSELENYVQTHFPPTLSERTGKGRHFFFICEGINDYAVLDAFNPPFGELRGDKHHQTVIAPSIHQSGAKYTIDGEFPIAKIERSFLMEKLLPFIKAKVDWNKIEGKKSENARIFIKDPISDVINLSQFHNVGGNRYQGGHPIHGSETGLNFCIDLNKNLWHCFRHNYGGSSIHLIAVLEKIIECGEKLRGDKFLDAFRLAEMKYKFEPLKDHAHEFEEFKNMDIKNINFIELAEKFHNSYPFIYDRTKSWWLWNFNKKCYERIDDADLLVFAHRCFPWLPITRSTIKSEFLTALTIVGRDNIPDDIKPTWIQFADEIADLETMDYVSPSKNYFLTNPIPHKIGQSTDTPTIDRLFNEWVTDEKQKQLLYEICAYSMLPDYPIHRIFCLLGKGRNGKGSFLRLIGRFLGLYNITSTDMERLKDSRFEASKLYKKLVAFVGETNFTALRDTALIKRLTGQDFISMEYKNKEPFDAINYAKIMIASNSLPLTLDKTSGFYSRWIIIDFPNCFDEGKDILSEIPEIEFENLALKCIRLLKDLIDRGRFLNEGSIEEKLKAYEEKSNPIGVFINQKCIKDVNGDIPFWEFFEKLDIFLRENGYRIMTKKEVSTWLKAEGHSTHLKWFKIPIADDPYMEKDTQWHSIMGLLWKMDVGFSSDNH